MIKVASGLWGRFLQLLGQLAMQDVLEMDDLCHAELLQGCVFVQTRCMYYLKARFHAFVALMMFLVCEHVGSTACLSYHQTIERS
ncbi:MAG: hypothetical protein EA339_11180 [Rhodobacteraceae bacterium]|nr:MAG: hypothetical protein EA339_11180 [Paracoccaceae bacterium]